MTLTNFLQLISNLNPNFFIYVNVKKQELPLAKIKINNNSCQLLTGEKPLTIMQLIKIVKNLHKRGIPLLVKNVPKDIPVYGIQIKLEEAKIILK